MNMVLVAFPHAGGNTGYGQDHNAKGIDIHKGYGENRPNTLLNWTQVAKRIEVLIAADRYLIDKEKEQYPDLALRTRKQNEPRD